MNKKRALISVTDKTGILDFAKKLINLNYEIISTGGTLKLLLENNIDAVSVESITNFPEILDGRLKTLHPLVHGGLLYKRDNLEHINTVKKYEIKSIDLVVINLYKFEDSVKNHSNNHDYIIENIDIGGPSMIRSAAKNYKDVLVLTDPCDYEITINKIVSKSLNNDFRVYLAMKAFSLTAYYDSVISRYFIKFSNNSSDYYTIGMKKVQKLRYGENPHQKSTLYQDNFNTSFLSDYEQLWGKELSFNNIADLNAAVELCSEFDPLKLEIATVAVKHGTPCGVALGNTVFESYQKTYESDPISIFGGIVVSNTEVCADTAKLMNKIFLEVIAAPNFTEAALKILKSKNNIRILKINFANKKSSFDIKYVSGKVLIQDSDNLDYTNFNIVTKKQPSNQEIIDLKFAMKVCKYVKSNAIVIAKDTTTVAIGGGQTSRIWALETAINNSKNKTLVNCVLASDAFFPFNDCVNKASEIGITSIIQPGGSINDKDSINACDENGISMIFTNTRHFKH